MSATGDKERRNHVVVGGIRRAVYPTWTGKSRVNIGLKANPRCALRERLKGAGLSAPKTRSASGRGGLCMDRFQWRLSVVSPADGAQRQHHDEQR